MYARATDIHAKSSAIDEGILHTRNTVMPALTEIDGCAGLSLIVDHDSGRCIATSSWRDEDAMRASEDAVRELRDHTAVMFKGTAEVSRWDIAVVRRDHRSRRGAGVRVAWVTGDPSRLERAVDVFKLASLPRLAELDGFCSASLLVDHQTGRMVASHTYDGMDTMRRAREGEDAVRAEGLREIDAAELTQVCEFELAIAHLHVNERV